MERFRQRTYIMKFGLRSRGDAMVALLSGSWLWKLSVEFGLEVYLGEEESVQ